MVSLDVQVVATALPVIRLQLHASLAALEWTVNAYTLSFAVLLLTGAALGERLGRRRMLAAGVGLFTAAFPPQRRAWALGIFSGVAGLAVLGGPVVGGAVTQGLAWPWIFWLNIPIGVLLVPLALRRMPESFGAPSKPDIGGLALVTAGAFGVVWGLVRANTAGWASVEVVAALMAGALLTAAFVVWELRAAEPMLPMWLFRSRAFSSGNAAALLMFGSLFGAVFFMAQFLQTALGNGPLGAGLRLAPWTATLFVVAPVGGALVNRTGERPLMVGGLVLQAAGMGWIALMARPGLAYIDLVAPLIVAGCGVSMAMPAAQNSIMGAVTASAIGKASGAFNSMRQLGGVLGIAIAVAVFAGLGGYGSARAFSDGFAPAMGVLAGLSLLGAVAAAAAPARREATASVAAPV